MAATPSRFGKLGEWDHAIGRKVYLLGQSPMQKHIATVFALSGDEATWLVLPVLAALGHVVTGRGPTATLGFCVELLGDILMVCVVEMLLKFCAQRERPPYAKQGTFYILP